ncbi:MAG TPA: YpdA family putative bacillithiol disulfide reductase [Longimicrobiales bacterium]|nr:YpdA family putative bacillithiol disulfide reductase [Longimicrobiales bacterium]
MTSEQEPREPWDIIVIGAGPCGIGVGAAAAEHGVRCLLIDKGCVASSIARYPTFMTFFSTADRLEIGGVPFLPTGDKPTRREALRYYQRLVPHFGINVRQYEEVIAVEQRSAGFIVRSRALSGEEHLRAASSIVVATGYFDHPNLLGVPGEQLPKVRHDYREGHDFFQQDVVVVGGGNSAVDAALELHRWGAHVTIVHFLPQLDANIKPWVRPDIEGRLRSGAIDARWSSRIMEIRPESVVIRSKDGATEELSNDFVLAMTGYTPDPSLLRSLGVRIDPLTGIPGHDPDTMETDVPGVFVAGVIVAGNDANKVFIENGRDHGSRIVRRVAERRTD